MAGEVKDDLGVGAAGHGEVEVRNAAMGAEVEDGGGFAFRLAGFAEGEDVGDLVEAGGAGRGEAEVLEEGLRVRDGCGVEDDAGLPGRFDGDGSGVVEARALGGWCGPWELEESKGEEGERVTRRGPGAGGWRGMGGLRAAAGLCEGLVLPSPQWKLMAGTAVRHVELGRPCAARNPCFILYRPGGWV